MDKFKSIFSGLEIAYGQYQPGERGENGKQKGKAFICRRDVTDDLWINHLKGKGPALGIIPITQNNDCRWGCIDIDEYNFNHLGLIQSIRKLNLPLIVCRSKSGGAHVFLFTKKNISDPSYPSMIAISFNLDCIKDAGMFSLVNKNTCAPPDLLRQTINGRLSLRILCMRLR